MLKSTEGNVDLPLVVGFIFWRLQREAAHTLISDDGPTGYDILGAELGMSGKEVLFLTAHVGRGSLRFSNPGFYQSHPENRKENADTCMNDMNEMPTHACLP